MPTGSYRTDGTAENCNEQTRFQVDGGSDYVANRPSAYLPTSPQQWEIAAEMLMWIDLCA